MGRHFETFTEKSTAVHGEARSSEGHTYICVYIYVQLHEHRGRNTSILYTYLKLYIDT